MSILVFNALRQFGATALWVSKNVGNDSKCEPLDLIASPWSGSAEGGASAKHPWAVRGSRWPDFGGTSTLNLDGVNDYMSTGDKTILTEMDQGFSFVIWFNTFGQTVAASETLFGANGGSVNDAYPQLWCRFQTSNSTIRLQIKNDAGTLWKADTGALANLTSGLHLLGCTFDWSEADGAGDVPATFYYDGQPAGYTASTEGNIAGGTTNDGDQKVFIGARSDKNTGSGVATNFSSCGFGPLGWLGGVLLTPFQHHEIYRLSRMHDSSISQGEVS